MLSRDVRQHMQTFGEISQLGTYAALPQIPVNEVQIVWIVESWDGPRSGVLLYRGERCWFEVVAENNSDDAGWYRRFAVVELTREQAAEEQRWQELFEEKVGHHPNLQPRDRWPEFYEPYQHRTPVDVSRNQALGWFER